MRDQVRFVGVCFLFWACIAGCQQGEDLGRTGGESAAGAPAADPQVEAQHTRGVALMGQFDYAAAHDVFEALRNAYPDWHDVSVDLAIAKLNRREGSDAEDAADILDSVVEKDAQNLRAKYCRAILLFYNGEIENALELFASVSATDPSDAYATYFAGQCLFDLGRFEEALGRFLDAQRLDPYLRSANYGAFQTLQRLGKMDDAKQQLAVFQKLADNPQARSAEIKYSRMGPKAEARAMPFDKSPEPLPEGPVFAEPTEMVVDRDVAWSTFDNGDTGEAPSITVCDINADGLLDMFIAGGASKPETENATNVLLLQTDGGWQVADHPLSNVTAVQAALWGDFDNDGNVDVYLCRRGKNQLWQQQDGEWTNITESAQADAGNFDTVDGAMFDADHDGDLDILVVHRNGQVELLNNNLDGTFRSLGEALSPTTERPPATGLVIADFDHDRDADIMIVRSEQPHDVFLNDRLWSYRAASLDVKDAFRQLLMAKIEAAVAADTDADGQVEIIVGGPDGVERWAPDADGDWTASSISSNDGYTSGPIAAQDLNGDGKVGVVSGAAFTSTLQGRSMGPFALAALTPGKGYSAVAATSGGPPVIWHPGTGRLPFAAMEFTGKESKADQMRSNASGIGISAAARFGGRWSSMQTFRDQSGPGQSRQPVCVGLGGEERIDYVHLVWPDGLFQTELGLAAGETHRIEETQRQVSSCPVLFVWNGIEFEFVTDVLGVGGLGFNGGRGEYHAPRPWENYLFEAGRPAERNGRFVMKLGEPMEESCYLDAMRLVAYDIPDGWQMVMDERQAVGAPEPTGAPIFFRESIPFAAAVDQDNRDVNALLAEADGNPVQPGKKDRRFLARTDPFHVTIRLESPLDLKGDERVALVIDGWIEYPYSQTMFAAWQANAPYNAPTLEARSTDGEWEVVYEEFGYPAGMPRRMSLPIETALLPKGTVELRLSTNIEIYWDRIQLVREEACVNVTTHSCELIASTLQEVGFPQRSNDENRRPSYDYRKRSPLWDTKHHPGVYTNFGDVMPLVDRVDDGVAVFGPGEEIELEFSADLPQLDPGKKRLFVLECHGWCKDMDLYTRDGETLGPLPRREADHDPEVERKRAELHSEFHQRIQSR